MKIEIGKNVLFEPLTQVAKAISAKSNIEILKGILFQADGSALSLTGSDVDLTIRATLSDVLIRERGAVVLSAKAVIEIVKHLHSASLIEIETQRNHWTRIKTGDKVIEIGGMDPEMYPKFKDSRSAESPIAIDGELFKTAIRKTSFACSQKEDQPVLKGVNIATRDNRIEFMASDKNRVSYASIETEEEDEPNDGIVISGDHLARIVHCLSDDETAYIHIGDVQTSITTGIYTILSRRLVGFFPNLDFLIANQSSHASCRVDKKTFVDSIKLALLTAGSSALIMFRVLNSKIRVSSGDQSSKSFDIVPATNFSGGPLQFACNGGFLQEAIHTIESDELILRFSGPLKPLYITGASELDEGFLQLVSPLVTREGEWVDN